MPTPLRPYTTPDAVALHLGNAGVNGDDIIDYINKASRFIACRIC